MSTCGDEGFHRLHFGEVDLAQSGRANRVMECGRSRERGGKHVASAAAVSAVSTACDIVLRRDIAPERGKAAGSRAIASPTRSVSASRPQGLKARGRCVAQVVRPEAAPRCLAFTWLSPRRGTFRRHAGRAPAAAARQSAIGPHGLDHHHLGDLLAREKPDDHACCSGPPQQTPRL